MLKKTIQVLLLLLILFFVIGCGTGQGDQRNVREAAWNFLVEKQWSGGVKEESWQDAEVREVTVDANYSLLDESYRGEPALSVSFKEKNNLATGVPLVIVSHRTTEVVGYMPSE